MNSELQINAREKRGYEIATTSLIVETEKGWRVPSQSGGGAYFVQSNGFGATCTCKDFKDRENKCKHIWAVESIVTGKVKQNIEENKKETYGQNWSAYDKATTNQKAQFMRLLSDLTRFVEQPQYSMGRPSLPINDMIFSSVMKVYSTFSLRRFMGDVEIAHSNDYISKVPCYSSIGHFMQREDITSILEELVTMTSLPFKSIETKFAVDSSGFGTSEFQRWFSFKYGKEVKSKRWVKCHIMAGVKTNIITSVKITSEVENDSPQLENLVKDTAYNFEISEVSADKAYLSRNNLEIIDKYGATPFIPFKSNSKASGKGDLWWKMYHYFMLNQKEFNEHYHKRSNVETTFHMIKSKFNNSVRAKTWNGQVNEVLCKIICHNICVLIHEMYELGISPDFETYFQNKQSSSENPILV
jgi:Transposase DDE domain./SWIM zinc finger.